MPRILLFILILCSRYGNAQSISVGVVNTWNFDNKGNENVVLITQGINAEYSYDFRSFHGLIGVQSIGGDFAAKVGFRTYKLKKHVGKFQPQKFIPYSGMDVHYYFEGTVANSDLPKMFGASLVLGADVRLNKCFFLCPVFQAGFSTRTMFYGTGVGIKLNINNI